jgi:hypothetical protein
MLKSTRFSAHFEALGDFSQHFGLFTGCGGGLPFDSASTSGGDSGSCC